MGKKSKLDSIFKKAKETVSNNQRVHDLLTDARVKLEKLGTDKEERGTFIRQLQTLVRMVRAHFNGTYNAFSVGTIVTVVFGLIYFVTPLDLIPDFIPALGLTDDISIIYFIFRNLSEDIEKFQVWEES